MPIRFTRRHNLPEDTAPLYDLVSYFTEREKLKQQNPKKRKK